MVLIVGATPYSQWQQTQPLLVQAGLALTDSCHLEDWYGQALSSPDQAIIERPVTPSAELTKQALAMLDSAVPSSVWGADSPDNVWLLEFWAQKSTASRFLLFYTRPEAALVEAMQQGVDPIDALQHWQRNTRQLLAFYRRNRRKALLIDASCALTEPQLFVETCVTTFNLVAKATDQPTLRIRQPSALLQLIAAQLIIQGPDLSALLAELEASATEIATEPQPRDENDFSSMFQEYLQPRLKTLQLATEKEQFILQLHQVKEELEATSLTAKTEAQIATDEKAVLSRQLAETQASQVKQQASAASQQASLISKLSAFETSHQDTEQENELLLLQLHQVQEELEATFLAAQAAEQTATDEKAALNRQLTEVLAGQSQRQASASSELDALKLKLTAFETSHQDSVQENELLLLQLHQVQEELEATFLAAQAAEQTVTDEKAARNRQRTEVLADQTQRQASTSSELDALKLKLTALETSHQDTEQENELLLLQLHQVQEELEHYFLQYQSLEEKIVLAESTRHVTESLALDRKLSKPGKIGKDRIKPLFHSSWYQKQAGKRTLPLAHYLKHGWKKQLSPHPLFDPQFYIEKHRLEDLNYCPLTHFIDVGHKLGYSPHPLFDSQWYLTEYPDVKESGINPLLHYLVCGANEGRDPSKAFHTDWYLATYPDVRESGMNPLLHFALHGKADERKQSPYQ